MAQHFLLSSAARSLSVATVARMSDEEAWDAFRLIRWSDTKGEPVCPRCGGLDAYTYKTRKVFRCRACSHQFTVTSGTIFASRKLAIRDKGEVARIVLGTLRDAKRPCTTQELTMHVMAERGMNTADKRLVKTVTKRVGSCLRHHRNRGVLQSNEGIGKRITWEVV